MAKLAAIDAHLCECASGTANGRVGYTAPLDEQAVLVQRK